MQHLSDIEFEEAVGEALDTIPPELAQAMDNVVVLVEHEPPSQDAGALPDRITIFQGPLERLCSTPEELRAEIAITVVHEVAHHFGIDDAHLHELGWG